MVVGVRRCTPEADSFFTPIWPQLGFPMTTSAANRKLTDVRLRALLDSPPSDRVELKDGTIDGLTLRVGPRGRPTWTFRFRIRGEGGLTDRGTKLNGAR